MASNLEKNPFTALFGSVKEAEVFRETIQNSAEPGVNSSQIIDVPAKSNDAETSILEKLLLVSTREPSKTFTCVHMDDAPLLNLETLDIILFERVLLQNPSSYVKNLKKNSRLKEDKLEVVARNEVMLYLYDVYERCWTYRNSEPQIANSVQSSVLNNLATALEQPEIFNGQQPCKQIQSLILNNIGDSVCLYHMVTRLLENNCKPGAFPYKTLFEEILTEVKKKLESCSLMGIEWGMLDVIDFYASSPILAPLLLVTPVRVGKPGRYFQETPIGCLLSISCLSKEIGGQSSEFFENPSTQGPQVHKATENSIGIAQKALNDRIYKIFMTLLKNSTEVKHLLLKWIETCLESNASRAGLWHIQAELHSLTFVSDGFMLNLGAVLLKLSAPFTKDALQNEPKDCKILKVDPQYCSPVVARNRERILGVYSGDLPKQTTLVPRSEDKEMEKRIEQHIPDNFSFTTTCFFHTHRALHLGIHVLHQKMFKLSQELGRLQHEFQEVSAQGSPATEMMRKRMEARTSLFLSYKAAAFEASLVDDLLQFLAASSLWLIQVALIPPGSSTNPITYRELCPTDLPLLHDAPPSPESALRDVPELLIETSVEAILAVRRYLPEALSLSGEPLLHAFMSLVAAFMGSPCWMNNPHLRAHLAECLETLLPKQEGSGGVIGNSNRGRLFCEHPLANHLVSAIIHVFVSIEMTGQSVAFEEKFNYRRPMYEVMKYLWDIPEHRKQFVQLANFALANMESARPPLFLRFTNLLMNDAIFLLDEGLSYMSQIRESQIQRDAGEWNGQTVEQRAERERNMQQNGFLARFHNMLGSRTIQMLVRLTKEIPTMFTHPTLIDRMAAMLNHFLAHLVGPKQRNLKVRDMEKYEFRPSEIVSDICTIYIHLSKKKEFCTAVSADDRSYSPELFRQACSVLTRIGRYQLMQELEEFSKSVNEASEKRSEEEDLAGNAPEEFIDPIMSQLMTDPVLLPSSQMIVDRQTIARHLLSDQTDPFNRQPLNMEEVISDTNLKTRIEEWLNQNRKKASGINFTSKAH